MLARHAHPSVFMFLIIRSGLERLPDGGLAFLLAKNHVGVEAIAR